MLDTGSAGLAIIWVCLGRPNAPNIIDGLLADDDVVK